jgi:hypothetical protein
MRKGWLVCIAGLAAAGWLGASSEAARAELRVMESTAPGISVDAVFPDAADFDVPAGKKIKLLKTPANTTHDIAGPYKGTLETYKPGCGMWDRFTGKCSQNTDVVGGTRSIAPVSGGTRGLTIPKQ